MNRTDRRRTVLTWLLAGILLSPVIAFVFAVLAYGWFNRVTVITGLLGIIGGALVWGLGDYIVLRLYNSFIRKDWSESEARLIGSKDKLTNVYRIRTKCVIRDHRYKELGYAQLTDTSLEVVGGMNYEDNRSKNWNRLRDFKLDEIITIEETFGFSYLDGATKFTFRKTGWKFILELEEPSKWRQALRAHPKTRAKISSRVSP